MVAVVFIALMTPWLARRVRAQGPEAVIVVGVMGSFLINHHMTPGDLMVLLVPVWLLLRERQSRRGDALLGAYLRSSTSGFTGVGGLFPSSTAMTFSAAVVAILVRVSREAEAMCGVRMTLSSARRGG